MMMTPGAAHPDPVLRPGSLPAADSPMADTHGAALVAVLDARIAQSGASAAAKV